MKVPILLKGALKYLPFVGVKIEKHISPDHLTADCKKVKPDELFICCLLSKLIAMICMLDLPLEEKIEAAEKLAEKYAINSEEFNTVSIISALTD